MGLRERREYVELFRSGEWTPARLRRLRELRHWRDVPTEKIPPELRSAADGPELSTEEAYRALAWSET